MKYIKNQFAKVVFLFLVISLIVTGMLKLADHDFIYSLSILFGCSSPAPLTLKICFFMFVILAQYFNADGFIFYIKNIDYLLIRYRSKYQTLRSLLKWVFFSNMVLVFTAFVGAVVALYFCTGSLSGSFSMDSIAILTRGFFHCVILAFFQVMLLIRVGETKCFGVILLLAVGYTFLKLSYSPLDSSAFLYRFALGGIIYSLGNDIASISDANMELVRSVNGTAIEETITTADGKQILLNAQVNTESVETIQQYQYEVLPVTDELRETLFTTFFGARASEAIYDQRNDVWELHNSEAIGDYYLYEHTIAMAGESVPGEEIFTLGYRDVNLYPFEDNLLSSSAECGVSIPLEDVISLCGTITDAIAPQNSYTADTVLPYGNQGRRPYYTIFFRRTAGGMPIIGYNDLYFLVDSNGIQTISGALYGLTAQPLSSELLSLEDAVASLRENTSLIDFYGEDTLSVGAISLEYIVTLTETQEAVAIPAWRFQIGTNDNSLMINRRRVLAVNAVTGELIQGERGRSF